MTKILDGKKVAKKILAPVKKEISKLAKRGIIPSLSIILVGQEDPQSLVYIREKEKKAEEIGVKTRVFRLKQKTRMAEVKNLIKKLNADYRVHGILVQLPLPSQLNPDEVLQMIEPKKEVDGLTKKSPYPPACALGIMKILDFYKIKIKNQRVVILGKGKTVGQPLYSLMQKAKAKVSLCSPKDTNIVSLAKKADILVGAVPVKDFIGKKMVKKDAVVIDAAKNVKKEVRQMAAALTPKIGGVGPTTVAMLLKSVVEAARRA